MIFRYFFTVFPRAFSQLFPIFFQFILAVEILQVQMKAFVKKHTQI